MVKKWSKNILLFLLAVCTLYLGVMKYQAHLAQQYREEFRAVKGDETVDQLARLYKEIVDYQAAYKLTPQNQAIIVQSLLKTGKQLKDIDQEMKSKYPARHVDFSYVYQDLLLVVKQLQDKANDAKLSVMVVHAIEGVGNIKIQLCMASH
ncbi:hypothetical protein PP175_08280 [Aneurinibacillus sp. Ricciae_BoGa-3]|uniref:hypothetical protein n=1 Tax=Aneurinibacillus sp. Ricciae_BoGa-3 TaxID=3022697 RepID=UPI00233FA933|nr:hypothetical protein [Aneurinibacillus sp. Ricciae_BoGa-3]WCK55901.1 hypothetical protein PP175_08280 [Aneurinibacillus sp. Ricciae_BoGa-3]